MVRWIVNYQKSWENWRLGIDPTGEPAMFVSVSEWLADRPSDLGEQGQACISVMMVYPIRLATQIIALELEVKTRNQMKLTRTPRSVLSMVKEEYGLRGNKVSVLAQLRQLKLEVDKALEENKTEI